MSSCRAKHRKGSSSSMVSQKTLTLLAPSEKRQKQLTLRERNVRKALKVFRELSSEAFNKLIKDNPREPRAKIKALWDAKGVITREDGCENTQKRVGPLEGIQIGDQFRYRAELVVVGLHLQPHCGIDYVEYNNRSLATSIVVTNRYENTFYNGSLVYIGEGGNPDGKNSASIHDQKLQRGNLALSNSMEARSPVRVILKVSKKSVNDSENESENTSMFSYVYDGLYLVQNWTRVRGQNGKLVFKFTLNRMSNQPPSCVAHGDLGWKGSSASSRTRRRSKGSSTSQKEKIRRNDVSEGKEKHEIPLMAKSDCVEMLPPFEYIVNAVYPRWFNWMPQPNPKDFRVKFQLAIYKTEKKGWGVRTRSFIPQGSLVCEFVGEVHPYPKDGPRLGPNNYILGMGAGRGYIDARRCGNVARFINHSCTPNLCVNEVYEDGERLPRMRLFAVRHIPAGRELTYNYNFCNRNLIKTDRIKCYCSSQECKGQIYI